MIVKQSIPYLQNTDLNEYYTKNQLYRICEHELFSKAKQMDISLLKEALYALDEQPDENTAPHRSYVWAKINQNIHKSEQKSIHKGISLVALILLLLIVTGGCLAWASHVGIISFPSIVFPWLPKIDNDAAQSLVQSDLFQAQYEHCELRVRETVFDGHQLRIVYSLRDTRESAVLSDEDIVSSSIVAAQLDGIGCCDYLTLDGQDVFLDDTFQLLGDENAEMLYYLAANIPEDVHVGDVAEIRMPIGELDLQTRKRTHEVLFSLNTKMAANNTFTAKKVSVVWDGQTIEVVRAEFSPLHGLVQVRFYTSESGRTPTPIELYLYTKDGVVIGQKWYSSYAGSIFLVNEIITQYISGDPWPKEMLLAPMLPDGSMDNSQVITLSWESQK